MINQEFEQWFEEVKNNAVEDFGYTTTEASNFDSKNWINYYDLGLTSFEALIQHLKKVSKHHVA